MINWKYLGFRLLVQLDRPFEVRLEWLSSLSINLPILSFIINRLIVSSMKCHKILKNIRVEGGIFKCFVLSNQMSETRWFRSLPHTILKSRKSSHFRVWSQEMFGIFASKMALMINQLSKWLPINFASIDSSINQVIVCWKWVFSLHSNNWHFINGKISIRLIDDENNCLVLPNVFCLCKKLTSSLWW